VKNKLSFLLTFISVVGLFLLAWFKNVDVQIMLPSVLGVYIVGRTTTNISSAWAASKDTNANTVQAIQILNEKE
jgi:hypothetical protein